MKLYTYEQAAEIIGLAGRSGVKRRLDSLADRGAALTVEAGEFMQVGKRLLLTERGVWRLMTFEPGKAGRPPVKPDNATTIVHQLA